MYSSSTFKGQIDGPYVQEVASATAASHHEDGLSKAVVSFAPAVLRRSCICAVVCRPFDVGFTFSLFGQCALISTMELAVIGNSLTLTVLVLVQTYQRPDWLVGLLYK